MDYERADNFFIERGDINTIHSTFQDLDRHHCLIIFVSVVSSAEEPVFAAVQPLKVIMDAFAALSLATNHWGQNCIYPEDTW